MINGRLNFKIGSPRCSHQPTDILAIMLMYLDHSWTADLSAIWIPK